VYKNVSEIHQRSLFTLNYVHMDPHKGISKVNKENCRAGISLSAGL